MGDYQKYMGRPHVYLKPVFPKINVLHKYSIKHRELTLVKYTELIQISPVSYSLIHVYVSE